MKRINDNCSICGNEIDEYAHYVNDDKQYYCCEECVKKAIYKQNFKGNILEIRFCPAYDYCKQLNNLRKMCKFKENITKKQYGMYGLLDIKSKPNWCSPAEASQIISNARLYNFVKTSEESSSRLNKESFNQNKTTKNLTWIMTGVSIVNLILICVQIYLQIFEG